MVQFTGSAHATTKQVLTCWFAACSCLTCWQAAVRYKVLRISSGLRVSRLRTQRQSCWQPNFTPAQDNMKVKVCQARANRAFCGWKSTALSLGTCSNYRNSSEQSDRTTRNSPLSGTSACCVVPASPRGMFDHASDTSFGHECSRRAYNSGFSWLVARPQS